MAHMLSTKTLPSGPDQSCPALTTVHYRSRSVGVAVRRRLSPLPSSAVAPHRSHLPGCRPSAPRRYCPRARQYATTAQLRVRGGRRRQHRREQQHGHEAGYYGREETCGSMAAKPCPERAEGDMGKDNVKKDKKKKNEEKKREEEAAETKGQEQKFDAAVKNLVAERDEAERKQSSKSKKGKRKHNDAGEASAGDQVVTREDKKRKKGHPVVLEESSQKQTFDTTVENLVAERDEVEGKQSSKSKKGKHKRNDAGEAFSADQVVTREEKKRKKEHPVMLKESSQPKNTGKGENGEIKERRKEGNTSSPEFSKNASAGGEEADVDGKKKKKSKEGTREGVKEKEKAARSKNKDKRVSFADSTEVFRTEDGDGEGSEGGKKKKKRATQSKNKGKRVSFADSAEVFSIKGGDNVEGGSSDESKFVHGERFTSEEDATLMEAIRDFIEMKQLGEKGLEMIRAPRKHPELRHCWDVIGKSLPHRPQISIYKRARILLHRSDERKWTQEEKEYIRRFVEKNGNDWKTLAHELGKCDIHVKDTWRRIKSENLKKGYWTQDEHQQLFDLVNLDLRKKALQIKNPTHRKLRDDISWEAISDKLTTRNHKGCCMKWYDTLASPLVRKGIWADVDDYLLVEALQKDDAVCVEDVDWDSLLDHRSGEVCRQRWNQMVRGIGGHREKPFIEQVDVLSRRYCLEMVEYRKPQK